MVHSCIFMWALKTYISPPLRHPNSRNVRVQRRLPFSRANKSRDRNSRNGEKPKSFRHSHFDSMLKWWFHAWRFGLVSGSQGNSRAPKSPIHICFFFFDCGHTRRVILQLINGLPCPSYPLQSRKGLYNQHGMVPPVPALPMRRIVRLRGQNCGSPSQSSPVLHQQMPSKDDLDTLWALP